MNAGLLRWTMMVFGLSMLGCNTASAQALALDPVIDGQVTALQGGAACLGGETYDDGSAENGYSGNPALISSFEAVQQFTPAAYPSTYDTACIALVGLGGPTLDFEIEVRDDDGTAGAPGTLLGTVPASVSDLPGGLPCTMYTFDISSLALNIPDGSVYIGVRWNPMDFPSRFVCADESGTTALHPSFVNFNNPSSWQSVETVFPAYRALMVRAVSSPLSYNVTATSSGNGSITPPAQTVDHDGTANFTVTPDIGYHVASVSGDTCTVTGSGSSYSAANITADCAVTADFAINSHLLGGSITGLAAGNSVVLQNNGGDDLNVAANGAFQFSTPLDYAAPYLVSVLTQPTTPAQNCLVTNDSGNMPDAEVSDVQVTCTTILHTVTGTVPGGNGSLSPANQDVADESVAMLTVTPDIGYHLDNISGCSGALGGNTYTTGPVTGDCTVTASFAIDTFVLTPVINGGNGQVSPPSQIVDYGDTAAFLIIPDNGFNIASVTGCGGTLAGNVYTTAPVTAACAIAVGFGLAAVAAPEMIPALDWSGLLALLTLLGILVGLVFYRQHGR